MEPRAAESEAAAPEASGQFVQSLARGLDVVRSFDAEHPQLTLSEVAARTGLNRATARRFLLTLTELGYVASDGRLFRLTPRILEIGYRYLAGLSLPELAEPFLEQLSHRLEESTSLSVLDGDAIVYVARVPTRRIMNVAITIGTRFPAAITSMGRVLLAAGPESAWPDDRREVLETVRAQGWAIVDQELERGLRSVAAPIHGADGRVVAAINVSTTTATASLERIRTEFLPAVLETAAAIDTAVAQARPHTPLGALRPGQPR
ncbi:IclR family transcriptional regulator domain-containing protein [Galbitalea soli]|uniref:Glycerol operon regulatory protein n=1 Tax=Galbitalea soli TaxID=1268042 RepID=A0A7C9TTI1_9MICO|nr:IclR family transcriptional regulator C-terminal domain-containing protein [Galbitalea soli]NEM92282.1 helix-turn-helix domain-containing protein [Galbitalea soli]